MNQGLSVQLNARQEPQEKTEKQEQLGYALLDAVQ